MIAACPKCAARYRIDRERIGAKGVRLRCSRCESVFRVRAPAPRPAGPVETPAASALSEGSAPAPSAFSEGSAPAPTAPPRPEPSAPSLAPSGPEGVESDTAARRPAPEPAASETAERATLLIAMPDADLAKRIAGVAESRGVRSAVVFDGVEAMLEVQRQEPRILLLAADLPKMFGFQVCEVVKRNASLRHIHVVLAGAVYDPRRYRRAPSQLYGADSFVEVPELPEGLLPILEREGLVEPPSRPEREDLVEPPSRPEREGLVEPPSPRPAEAASAPGTPPPAPEPAGFDLSDAFGEPDRSEPSTGRVAQAPIAAPDAAPSPSLEFDFDLEGDLGAPESPAPGPELPAAPPPRVFSDPPAAPPALSPEQAEQRAQAERLARIIVSDIVLYNEEKFQAALREGNVEEAMAAELDEGRGLFEQRIDAAVRAQTDFLTDELLRVARAREMA